MKGFVLVAAAVVPALFAVESADAGQPVIRRGLFGRPVVVAPFRQAIVAPQPLIVRQQFLAPVQRFVVPQVVVPGVQTFVAPVQSFRVQAFSSGGLLIH
jgi:hypothetical protein